MLSDFARVQDQKTSEFRNPFTKNCSFSLDEAKLALSYLHRYMSKVSKPGLKANLSKLKLQMKDLSENSKKILLGLALVNKQEYLFSEISHCLGSTI